MLPPSSGDLPPLYHRWVAELLGPLPRETEATCDRCAMLPPAGATPTPAFFDPRTKCCTFHPSLPNFLAGAALADADPDSAPGARALAARIAAGHGVTPFAVDTPRDYALLFTHGQPAFGHSVALRCPYYVEEGGRCGVWRHRNSMCATWFCKHSRASVGLHFWRSVHRLLTTVERALAWWCIVELAPGRESLERLLPVYTGGDTDPPLTPQELDRTVDPKAHRALWGRFAGREADFYRAAAALVSPLSWSDVLARSGPQAQIAVTLLREAHHELLSTDLPPSLRPGQFQLVQIGPTRARVRAYSVYDPVDMPRQLLDLLARFDGRPVDEVLASIAAEGTRVAPALIRRLADFGILVPPHAIEAG